MQDINLKCIQRHLAAAISRGRSKAAECLGPSTVNIEYLFQGSSFNRAIKLISFNTDLFRGVVIQIKNSLWNRNVILHMTQVHQLLNAIWTSQTRTAWNPLVRLLSSVISAILNLIMRKELIVIKERSIS